MDNPVGIEIRGLVTGYGRKGRRSIVMRPLDASLRSGELTCLLGPNGAGKSTLLKTLSGFLPPLEGEIVVEGKPLSSYRRNELSRILGVVLTERTAPEDMSVRQMVELGRSPYTGFWGRLGEYDRRVVDEAVELTGIKNLESRLVSDLSDGERQKVMIAKVLAQETPFIFLDEPTAFLDYPSKVETMRLLHFLSRVKSKTIFMSTHDLDLALQISDTVWLIDKTHGVAIGNPEDLALQGRLSDYFAGKGVVFDAFAGLFRLQDKCDVRIAIRGKGIYRSMAVKALARNGVAAVDAAEEAAPLIDVCDDGFKIGDIRVGSIAELLSVLKKMGIIKNEKEA